MKNQNNQVIMKTLVVSCLFLLFLLSCKKDVKELPPATQTGANTFGAKVNGDLWVPQGFGSISASNILEARLLGNNFFLVAQNFASSPNETEFDISIIGINGTGTYLLNANVSHPSYTSSYGYYVKRRLSPLNEWITTSTQTGMVNISRFDTTSRIVSGTFQFNGQEINNSTGPISITEGRFDVRY